MCPPVPTSSGRYARFSACFPSAVFGLRRPVRPDSGVLGTLRTLALLTWVGVRPGRSVFGNSVCPAVLAGATWHTRHSESSGFHTSFLDRRMPCRFSSTCKAGVIFPLGTCLGILTVYTRRGRQRTSDHAAWLKCCRDRKVRPAAGLPACPPDPSSALDILSCDSVFFGLIAIFTAHASL